MNLMALRLYNTLTSRVEDFVPLNDKIVKIYVCGPTVYDYCHMGHARAYVVFDTLRRYLLYRGYHVTYVQNFTDVDDKILRRAGEKGIALSSLRTSSSTPISRTWTGSTS